jgi:uncharacterized protein (TIGR04141 family)
LGDFCLAVDEIANRTVYRQRFRWIDYVEPLTDVTLVDALENQVVALLRSPDPEGGVRLAPPEVVDWETLASFQFHFDRRRRGGGVTHPDITLGDYLSGLRRRDPGLEEITPSRLKTRMITGLTGNGGVYRDWSVWKCLVAEFEVEGASYILDDGAFYKVDRDFLRGLNDDILRLSPDNFVLEDARLNEEEKEYNRRIAQSTNGYLKLDRELIRFADNRDGMELCDILTSRKQLIHVKCYTGSATLSHLFNQARVSADLLQVNEAFQAAAREKVRNLSGDDDRFNFVGDTNAIRNGEVEVVLGIIRRWNGLGVNSLPFFSKLTLRRVATELASRGFGVRVALIQRRLA